MGMIPFSSGGERALLTAANASQCGGAMFEDFIGLPLLTDAHKSVLRCYLAVSDVAALSLQGDWLSNDHLVESTRIWLQQNALTASWLERIEVVAQAREIARKGGGGGLSDSDDARPGQL